MKKLSTALRQFARPSSFVSLAFAFFILFSLYISRYLVKDEPALTTVLCIQAAFIAALSWIILREDFGRKPLQSIKLDKIFTGLVLFDIALICSGLINHSNFETNYRLSTWILAPVFYLLFKFLSDQDLIRAMLFVLPLYIVHGAFYENENIFAFFFTGITCLLMLYQKRELIKALIIEVILLFYVYTCSGSLLALLAVFISQLKKRIVVLAFSFAALFLLIVQIFGDKVSNLLQSHHRDVLYKDALKFFLQAPIIGQGISFKYMVYADQPRKGIDAHNFLLTVLVETGIVGLFCIIAVILGIIKIWPRLPAGSKILIIMYSSWSMVDDPFQWWGSNLLLLLALTRSESTKEFQDAAAQA
jgi:O-antigen ligase